MKQLIIIVLIVWLPVKAATYYIDYETGADTNAGTSKAMAWKRLPFMNGFSGSYNYQSGDRFILKGGVTWPNAAFPVLIQNAWNRDYSGTTDAWNVITSDTTWHKGAGWSYPVFDLEGEKPSKPVCLEGHNSPLQYWRLQYLEIRNQYCDGFGQGGISIANAAYIMVSNCYLHDWQTVAGYDSKLGGITAGNVSDIVVDNCIIRGPLNPDSTSSGCGTYNVRTVRYCDISNVPNGIFGARIGHHNHVHHIRGSQSSATHENAFWCYAGTGSDAGRIYNNVVHDVPYGSGGIYPVIAWGGSSGTIYLYNNIIFDHGSGSIHVDPSGSSSSSVMKVYIFNNILRAVITTPRVGSPAYHTFHIKNNLFIGATGDGISIYQEAETGDKQIANNVYLTYAEAESRGLTKVAWYKPDQPVDVLTDQGLDLTTVFDHDFDDVTRPQGSAWDIGAYEYTASGMFKSQYPISNVQHPMSNEKLQQGIYDLGGRDISRSHTGSGIYMVLTGTEIRKIFIIK